VKRGRLIFLAIVLVASCLVFEPSLAQISATGVVSCTSADQAARRALRDAATRSEQWQLDHRGASVEFSGWIYRTPDGGYGYTEPLSGTAHAANPSILLASARPSGEDDGAYAPHLRTGEEVVGAYHTHPSGGDYENEHFSPDDRAFAERFNVPVYLRTPNERYLEYDPNTDAQTPIDPLESVACPETDDGDWFGGMMDWLGGMMGDPHILPLDGGVFDFQAAGEFIAIQSPGGDLIVQARLEPYLTSGSVSVMTAVAVKLPRRRIGIYAQEPHVRIGGHDIREWLGDAQTGRVALPDDARIDLRKGEVEITGPRGDRIRIVFHMNRYLDAYFALPQSRQGAVSGLLGNFDGEPGNDLVTRQGTTVQLASATGVEFRQKFYRDWGDSWRISATESLFDYPRGRTAADYDIRDYPREVRAYSEIASSPEATWAEASCRATGITADPLLARCIYDLVVTGDECFIATYVDLREMMARGYDAPASLRADVDTKLFELVINEPGTYQIETFKAQAGQRMFFRALVSGSLYWSVWEVVDPEGKTIFKDNLAGSMQPGEHILPTTGAYRSSITTYGSETGTLRVARNLVPATQAFDVSLPVEIAPDAPRLGAGRIEVPGAKDVYRFAANAGDELELSVPRNDDRLYLGLWQLIDPNGNMLLDGIMPTAGASKTAVTLKASGTYTLTATGGNKGVPSMYDYGYGEYGIRIDVSPR
jgi:proteasome lid subunit RPN8/RPN11